MPEAKEAVGDNVALFLFFAFWYAGNVKYNEVKSCG